MAHFLKKRPHTATLTPFDETTCPCLMAPCCFVNLDGCLFVDQKTGFGQQKFRLTMGQPYSFSVNLCSPN